MEKLLKNNNDTSFMFFIHVVVTVAIVLTKIMSCKLWFS